MNLFTKAFIVLGPGSSLKYEKLFIFIDEEIEYQKGQINYNLTTETNNLTN